MDEPPVQTLSHYRLIEKIGEGGMGVVWKAEDTILGRTVAIKILPADVSRDERRRAMFLEEARAASAASHAHVVQTHDFGHERGLDFIVMEYVEGRPLGKILVGRPLPPDKVAQLGVQIARALQAAHKKGLLHRDLKPSNVLVTPDGEVKVVDFGLAALFAGRSDTRGEDDTRTASGPAGGGASTIAGTLPYMSPEQLAEEPLDGRSDIFSLGVVLYEMATGVRPFAGPNPTELARAIAAANPTPVHDLVPSVPLELERIIQKALARKPGERYQTMDDFAVDLRRLDRDLESGSAPSYEALRGAVTLPPSTPPTSGEPTARSFSPRLLVALVAVSALGAFGSWLVLGHRPSGDPKTVLVVPFETRGSGAGDPDLGQALAEAVAVNLADSPGLKVLPVANAPAGGSSLSAAHAAGAGRVLEGSVTREAGVIHVNLRLLDSADGRILGGAVRDDAQVSLPQLATHLAVEIASKLGGTAPIAYEYPPYVTNDARIGSSPAAMEAVNLWRQDQSNGAYDAAVRLTKEFPDSVPAWAFRAFIVDQIVSGGVDARTKELSEILTTLDRIDPRNPFSAIFRVRARSTGNDPGMLAGKEALLSRDDLTPSCRAWVLRSLATENVRRLDYASWLDVLAGPPGANALLRDDIEDLRRARSLDPASAWSSLYLSWALHLTGGNDEAIDLARRATVLEPGFTLPRTVLGSYLSAAGQWGPAADVLGKNCNETSKTSCFLLAVALRRAGRTADAETAYERGLATDKPSALSLLQQARYVHLRGERASAKELVGKALAAGLARERLAAEPELAALASP